MNPGDNQQASEAQPTLSEAIAETFDEMEAAAEDEENLEDEQVEETGQAEEEAETEEEDDQGEPAAEAGEDDPGEEPGEEVRDDLDDWDEPAPERWPAEMKQAYEDLPKAARKVMLEQVFKPMQRTYTQGTQELSQMKAALTPMLQSMQEHGESLQKMGLDAPEAFRRQMAWAAHFAQVGPEKGIEDMRAAYGLNAQQQGQDTPQEEYMTPVERAMKARLDQLESHLGQAEQTVTQRFEQEQQQAIQARAQSIRTELQSFTSEMKDGKPAHPHVDKVGHAMAGLIRGGLVEKFDEYGSPVPVRQQINQAYSLACQMDPSIRSTSPRRSQEQVRKAAAANQTAVGNTTSGPAEVADRPIVDDISDLYDRLNRRTG